MDSLTSVGTEHLILSLIARFNKEGIVRITLPLSLPGIARICFCPRYVALCAY